MKPSSVLDKEAPQTEWVPDPKWEEEWYREWEKNNGKSLQKQREEQQSEEMNSDDETLGES